MQLMPTAVKTQRNPRHAKKILDQWYLCALRSQSEAIREFYKQVLVNIASKGGHLWQDLVDHIKIDETMATFPKVTPKKKKDDAEERTKDERRNDTALR